MAQYIALIRGINLGQAKRVPMTDLRAAIRDQGYAQVRTVLNSGNVVLTASSADPADIAADIEEALVDRVGVSARVMVLTSAQLVAVVRDNPFPRRRVIHRAWSWPFSLIPATGRGWNRCWRRTGRPMPWPWENVSPTCGAPRARWVGPWSRRLIVLWATR